MVVREAAGEDASAEVDQYIETHFNMNEGVEELPYRYVSVPADSYGLTEDEILWSDDKFLNEYVGQALLAPFREDAEQVARKFNRGRFEAFKRKKFGELADERRQRELEEKEDAEVMGQAAPAEQARESKGKRPARAVAEDGANADDGGRKRKRRRRRKAPAVSDDRMATYQL